MAQPDKRTPQGKHSILHQALGKTIVVDNGISEAVDSLTGIASERADMEEVIKFTLLTLNAVRDELKSVQRAIAKVNAQLTMEVDNPYD